MSDATETTEATTETGSAIDNQDELNQFLATTEAGDKAEADAETASVREQVGEKVEEVTEDMARGAIIGSVGVLQQVGSMITGANLKVSDTEVKLLADDVAPAIVKMSQSSAEVPPWMKTLYKHRIELIALKGIFLFGLSLFAEYKKFKLEERKIKLAEQKAKPRIRVESGGVIDGD